VISAARYHLAAHIADHFALATAAVNFTR
jgi:hypothetical protein